MAFQEQLENIVHEAVDKCNPASDGERFCLFNIIEAACKEAVLIAPQAGTNVLCVECDRPELSYRHNAGTSPFAHKFQPKGADEASLG
jgi:hypothetical protein